MTAHLTEEEQLEALKRWWNENGKSTIVAIAIAVAGYFGWQTWESNQQVQAERASSSYQDLLEALTVNPGQMLSEEKRATVVHLSKELKDNHEASLYASQAALFLAKMAVENNELEQAEKELQWVLSKDVDATLIKVTNNRLARVLLAQEKLDDALALVSEADAGIFASLYAETRGDILLAKGDVQAARAAYQSAQASLTESDRSRAPFLAMKIDDLQLPPVVELLEESGESETQAEDAGIENNKNESGETL